MSKKNFYLNIAIIMMIIAIILLVVFKFVINDNRNDVSLDIEKTNLVDLNGNKIKLSQMLSNDKVTYCLIFDMNDCPSCILKGLNDLSELKKTGLKSMAIVVHNRIDEVSGWSSNYDYSPFYMLNRNKFYEYIHVQSTPVIIKIRNGKVENYRYIFP